MPNPSLSHLYFESVRVSKAPLLWFVAAILLHIGLFCSPMRNYKPSRQEIVFYQGDAGIEVQLMEELAPPLVDPPIAPAVVPLAPDVAFVEPASRPEEASLVAKSMAPDSAPARPQPTKARRAGTAAAQPASQVFTTQPPYPPAARELGIEGAVRLQVRVGVDGCPRAVTVVRSSGRSDFDLCSVTTVRREWRFRPARTADGDIVESTIVVAIHFTLKS
jgi:TonB family protein